MTSTQPEKAARFRALHEGPGAFVIPSPWDAGSARVLAALGFQALATSSGACTSDNDGHAAGSEPCRPPQRVLVMILTSLAGPRRLSMRDTPSVRCESTFDSLSRAPPSSGRRNYRRMVFRSMTAVTSIRASTREPPVISSRPPSPGFRLS